MADGPDNEISLGLTYEMRSFSAGVLLTRVVAERDLGGGLWRVRAANGLDSLTFANHLTGPVEALRPGVEAPCLLCHGEKVVPIDGPVDPDRPWLRVVVGHDPCPNCGTVDPGRKDAEIDSEIDEDPVR